MRRSRLAWTFGAAWRVAASFMIAAAVCIALGLGTIAAGYTSPNDSKALAVFGLLFVAVTGTVLATDWITDLGPFPGPKPPLGIRMRSARLARHIRRLRVRNRATARLHRLSRHHQRLRSRLMLDLPHLSIALDRLSATDLSAALAGNGRNALVRAYHDALLQLHPSARGRTTLDTVALSPLGRVLFLPVLIEAGDARRFDRLDLTASDATCGRWVFTGTGRAIDADAWQRKIPTIDALLGGNWRIEGTDGVSLTLIRRPDMPAAFPLDPAWHMPGRLFLGRDLMTGEPMHLGLGELTHTLVVGAAGLGKSSFLRQVLLQLARQPDQVAAVHVVDLKLGLEFGGLAAAFPHVDIVTRYEDVAGLLERLQETMATRFAALAAAGAIEWTGPPILVVVDEFAEIMLARDSKEGRQAVLDGFIRLGNLARAAGIYLWLQTQRAVTETMPTALKANLTATVSFRQPSAQAAAQVFGDTADMPADITRLARGQLIFRHGRTTQTSALQSALVPHEHMRGNASA